MTNTIPLAPRLQADLRTNDRGMHCLNDLHHIAVATGFARTEQRPSAWLKSEHAQRQYIKSLTNRVDGEATYSIQVGKGRAGTWGCDRVLLEYARWLSPEFASQLHQHYLDIQAQWEHAPLDPTNRLVCRESAMLCTALTGSQPWELKSRFGWCNWRTRLEQLRPHYLEDAEVYNQSLLEQGKTFTERKLELTRVAAPHRAEVRRHLNLLPSLD